MTVPLADLVACVRREIAFRERCYPRWVAGQKLTQAAADHELAAMRAVLATVEAAQRADDKTSPNPNPALPRADVYP